MRWVGRRNRAPAALGAVLLGVLLGGTACSHGDDIGGHSGSGPSAGASGGTDASPVQTVTTVERLSGHLNDGHRQRLTAGVNAVMDAYFDGAYLGSFPRSDYSAAFADFTKGARTDALRQLDTLSNQPISGRIDKATATNRRVRLDVFAPKGRPRGATAHFVLDFDTSGSLQQHLRVHGELYLTKSHGSWHVFGYDVDQAAKL